MNLPIFVFVFFNAFVEVAIFRKLYNNIGVYEAFQRLKCSMVLNFKMYYYRRIVEKKNKENKIIFLIINTGSLFYWLLLIRVIFFIRTSSEHPSEGRPCLLHRVKSLSFLHILFLSRMFPKNDTFWKRHSRECFPNTIITISSRLGLRLSLEWLLTLVLVEYY